MKIELKVEGKTILTVAGAENYAIKRIVTKMSGQAEYVSWVIEID